MMKVNIVSHKKNELHFEIEGEGHLFSKLLISKLLDEKDVELAQYDIDHPLTGKPIFYIKTEKKDPMDALKSAAKSMKKDIEGLMKAL